MASEQIQEFLQQASELNLSACTVSYAYSLLNAETIESYKLTVFGASSLPDLQINKEKLNSLGHFFLQVRQFQDLGEPKVWDKNPGKYTIIGFIEEVTEDVLNTLDRWENSQNTNISFYLIVFKKDLVLPQFKKIIQKKGKKQVRSNFNFPSLPWVSVIFDSYEICKCRFADFFISDWENLTKKHSPLEVVTFFETYNEVLVYQAIKKKEKKISLNGIVILDFFDESCQEDYKKVENFSEKVRYFQVYSGIDHINFRYSLEGKGLNHPTAAKLKIIECPCTLVFCNQKLVWRGNKLFDDFKQIVKSFTEGNSKEDALFSEKRILKNFNKVKQELLNNDQYIIDAKLDVLYTVSSFNIFDKKFRTRLEVSFEEGDKEKSDKIFEKLSGFLPNLSLEITHKKSIFSTEISSKNNPKNKGKDLFRKIEKLKKIINEQKSKLDEYEKTLKEKNESLEKKSGIIQELKSSNLGKLHLRIDKMIEEKTKNEIELEEKNKSIRELNQRILNLKKDLEHNDEVNEKRDNQLNNLIQKIKHQEQEIFSLTSKLSQKTKTVLTLQGEVTELRPSKEAMNILEKQKHLIEELKKTIHTKDKEIQYFRSTIRSSNLIDSNDQSFYSPHKLPKITSNRSGHLRKSKDHSVSKSINRGKIKLESEDFEQELRLEEIENLRLAELENQRIQEEKEKEKLLEAENEEKELKSMETEDNLSRFFQVFLQEAEKKLQEEAEKKIKKEAEKISQEEGKKSKPGQSKGKSGSKPGKKK